MKKLVAILLCVIFVASLAACGKDYGYDYYNYDLSDYITVGDYTGLNITVYTKSRDREKQNVIDYYTEYYATSDEKATVAEGDTISATYTCTIDGEKIAAESGEKKYIKLGQGTLLPEVEAAIIGMICEKPVSVEATFPADYSNTAVAGKTAKFEITAHHVMVPAEYNDEFVATYFEAYGVSTMAEFDAYMNRNFILNATIEAIMKTETFKVHKYPELELNAKVDEQCAYDDSTYQSYGFTLEEVLAASDMTLKDYKEKLATSESILSSLKTEMIYHYIIRTEGFEASEEEATTLRDELITDSLSYYKEMYEAYGITGATLDSYLANALASLKQTYTVEQCKLNILYDLVEEVLATSQNVNYVDEFDPAEEENKAEEN